MREIKSKENKRQDMKNIVRNFDLVTFAFNNKKRNKEKSKQRQQKIQCKESESKYFSSSLEKLKCYVFRRSRQ